METLIEKRDNKPKHEWIAGDIKQRILSGKYAVGQTLPSNRELMDEYGVALATARQAMSSLELQGFIESKQGKGTFVADFSNLNSRLRLVDIIIFGLNVSPKNKDFINEFLNRFSVLLGSKGVSVRVNVIKPLGDKYVYDEAMKLIDELEPECLVCMHAFGDMIVDGILNSGIPSIFWCPNIYNLPKQSIVVDDRSLIRQALEHLFELGHRKIGFLHSVDENLYVRQMNIHFNMFYEEMGRLGLIVDPDLVQWGGFSYESGYKGTNKLCDSKKEFTAIFGNDFIAKSIYDVIESRGRLVGKDVSVVGYTDMGWCSHMTPSLTSVRISRQRAVELVLESIMGMFKVPVKFFDVKEVPVDLVVRESTAKING